jgi:hypothetical protein
MSKIAQILHKEIDGVEVGEMLKYAQRRIVHVINNIVQKNYDQGTRGKYYIHFWFQPQGEQYAPNYQCRRTRPSPYQTEDHYLWSVEDGGKVTFEWCIPKKETLAYVLNNPSEFDADYVSDLKKYVSGKIDKIEDYLVDGKVV